MAQCMGGQYADFYIVTSTRSAMMGLFAQIKIVLQRCLKSY